ncbi:hypothetical protein PF005_g26775 [Phytophthora fragariae]|uniref:Uncharacterized protein n=1 Tax=Phytophthora fragariae TaxID=53985 RepID=A0A6A3KQ21_9STRA|nr:hypothetical protein PF003_g23680 [Phytophthora fragariae]KAE8945935.1 hypothetical protein PF009_g4401 [Phytophthora fragariae]KAE9009282.1 hypothetical protein PF011_g10335 [Phytophthora fragariae]KAE9070385.1 hypothetical protein PF010_g26298 [Phytophthora fragariae]KAE9071025.1 hypothetical protein PF007_g26712 [Phytophthora fragariae]
MLGESAEWLDLSGCASFDEFQGRLRRYDARYTVKVCVVGIGWAQDDLSSIAWYTT